MRPTRETILALQRMLMDGVRTYDDIDSIGEHAQRFLATAAALDYVLMLVTETAGVRIAADDARRAIHDGVARALDDTLALISLLLDAKATDAHAFCRSHGTGEGMLTMLTGFMRDPELATSERRFTLIAIANDLSTA